jgi:hypothetical protein
MEARVKLDKLALSARGKGQIYYPYQDGLPNYHYDGFFNPNVDKVEDRTVFKYENVVKFKHAENGNRLIVCNKRIKDAPNASPLYLIFYTNYDHIISYSDVHLVVKHFRQFHVNLRVSQIHLATDLISDQRAGLYASVIGAIKPGFKRQPSRIYDTSVYFGKAISSNALIVYDKLVELAKEKGIHLPGDVCRVETRLKPPKLFNFVQTIEDLVVQDWSFVYPKYFSLHQLKPELEKGMESIGIECGKPIWELRDKMEDRFGIMSSNFYRDYLMDHSSFSGPVRDALSDYRWCLNYKQFQS